jgi:Uma2 family endonuclease
MIAARENFPQFTPKEYFAWEEKQLNKHEYIEGEVYAMSGGSVNHGRIAIRFTTMFDSHLEGSSCITGNSDIKVKIVKTNNFTYVIAQIYRGLTLTTESEEQGTST